MEFVLSSRMLINIFLLNVISVMFTGSLKSCREILEKALPYCLGAIIVGLWKHPTDIVAILSKVTQVYLHRLIWEMIVMFYM